MIIFCAVSVWNGSREEFLMSNIKGNGLRNEKTRWLVQLAMWTALTLILAFVPFLGYITIGPFSITTVHIPVIIGAVMLGPVAGAFLGLVFGITSIIQATIQMPITAFMFSPFVPFGNFNSVIVAIVPRVLVGIFAAYIYKFIKIKDKKGYIASLTAGIVGALTNTVFVLSGVYVFFGQQYAASSKIPFSALFGVLLGVVATNGVVEAIVAAVVVTAVTKALFATYKRIYRT